MRIRVLLVEDEPSNAELVHEMLSFERASKFEFTDAWCLRDALDKLVDRTFDAILLDLGLPDSEGIEAVREVRAVAPSTPVIVLTGMDDEALATAAMQIGAHGFLRKQEMTASRLENALFSATGREEAAGEGLKSGSDVP